MKDGLLPGITIYYEESSISIGEYKVKKMKIKKIKTKRMTLYLE